MPHPESERYAEAAVREGVLSAEALAAFRAANPALDPEQFLGFALLDRGVLSPEAFRKVLEAADLHALGCGPCRIRQVFKGFDPDHLYVCPACAGAMTVLGRSDDLHADTTLPALAAGPADDLIGETIGDCQIQSRLGAGGMGVVYRARHLALNKAVAVKVLSPSLILEPAQIQRFVREAQATARLEHPNVVQVLNVGKKGTCHFIVMQCVEGSSVGARLKAEGRIEPREACRIVCESALGLHAAHQVGIIHRDIKPDNLLLSREGQVKVTDFGLAKIQQGAESLSQTGMVLGTPNYMSPEQASGKPLDVRSDIYSLGATFYHLVTGQPPFAGETPLSVLLKHIQEDPRDPCEIALDVPPVVRDVIARMMAKDREARYPGMESVARDLEMLLDAPAWPPDSSILVGGAGTAASARTRGISMRLAAGVAAAAGVLLMLAIFRPWGCGSARPPDGGSASKPPAEKLPVGKPPPEKPPPEKPPPEKPPPDPFALLRTEVDRFRAAGNPRAALDVVEGFASKPEAATARDAIKAIRAGLLEEIRRLGEEAVREGDRRLAAGLPAEARTFYERAISLRLSAERFHKDALDRISRLEERAQPASLDEIQALLKAGRLEDAWKRLQVPPPGLSPDAARQFAWLRQWTANTREGMVFVPEGESVIGNEKGFPNERPERRVKLKGFFIDRTEVSNRQFQRYVEATLAHAPFGWRAGKPAPGTEDLPVAWVAWEDAKRYAAWAGKRLPSEEEWERAARGDSLRLYQWGDKFEPDRANSRSGGSGRLEPVGTRTSGASPFGCLHMAGNAWEWTDSPNAPYPGGPDKDPLYKKGFKVVRGGDFHEPPDMIQTSARLGKSPDAAGPTLGLRCVRDLSP